jgi:hypothetical protein
MMTVLNANAFEHFYLTINFQREIKLVYTVAYFDLIQQAFIKRCECGCLVEIGEHIIVELRSNTLVAHKIIVY